MSAPLAPIHSASAVYTHAENLFFVRRQSYCTSKVTCCRKLNHVQHLKLRMCGDVHVRSEAVVGRRHRQLVQRYVIPVPQTKRVQRA